MFVRHSTEIMLTKCHAYCDQLQELIDPLRELDITGFTYHRFHDIQNNMVRDFSLLSDQRMVEHFLGKIEALPETGFVEFQKYPLKETAVFSPFNKKLCSPDSNRKIDYELGIQHSICVSLRDDIQRKTELFWFNSKSEDKNWLLTQIENKRTLNQFILYFKDKMQKTLKSPMITSKEMSVISNQINETRTEYVFQNGSKKTGGFPHEASNYFKINTYFLGFPFKDGITEREFQVVRFYNLNLSSKEIAGIINVSPRTVEKRLEVLLKKTVCKNLRELKKALQLCPLLSGLL